MPGRNFSSGDYRYGFGGHEKDDEISGSGNHLAFGDYGYDTRLGRRWNIEPLIKKYPNLSSYVVFANNPIHFADPDGNEIVVPNVADRAPILKMINAKAVGTFAFDKTGKLYQVSAKGDATKFSQYYSDKLVEGINSDKIITVKIAAKFTYGGKEYDTDKDWGGAATAGGVGTDQSTWISGNENKNLKDTDGKPLVDKPADILAHELVGHAIPKAVKTDTGNAVENENKVRKEVKADGQKGKSPQRAAEPEHKE